MHHHIKTRKLCGFTILEMLLSLGVLSVLFGIAAPVYQSVQVRNDLDTTTNALVQTLRRAQTLSQVIENDASWGVFVVKGSFTLFQGADFASRDTAFDETFGIPNAITPSGIQEVVFGRFTGEPNTVGTITLTSSLGDARTINIGEKGTILF